MKRKTACTPRRPSSNGFSPTRSRRSGPNSGPERFPKIIDILPVGENGFKPAFLRRSGTNVFSARQKEDSWNRPSLPAPNWTLPNKRRTFAFWPAVRIPTARLLEQALLSRGATVDRIRLREYAIHPCIGCGYCSAHPGHCVFDGDDVADLFRRMEHADSLILNIPVYFYGPPALLKGFIDRAQIFWEQRREGTRTPRRPAHAVLCAARTRGDRLFEANLLILRCFLDTLGFSLHEPLLLRGVERPTDLLHSQAIAQIERFGLEAAEQATRFYHE